VTDRSESRPVWVAIVRPRTGCRKAPPTYVCPINEVGFRPICPHCSQLEAFPLRYGLFYPTLLQFLPNHHFPAWKCVVGCRRDASSANPLTTFKQSNIRVSFLHDGALDDACEAVSPATRSCLACFRYRCLGTTRLYRLHSAMIPSLLAKRLSRPRVYAAPERPPSSFWGYVGYWPSPRCFCLLLFS
jgi:hypothetical protein